MSVAKLGTGNGRSLGITGVLIRSMDEDQCWLAVMHDDIVTTTTTVWIECLTVKALTNISHGIA